MGLLDMFGLAPTTGLLSDPNAGLALVAGLLGAKKGEGLAGLGRGLLTGAQTYNQDQQQERANRASDLQQLQGAYSMLKQQEFAKMLAARQSGQPYMPNPMLPQMEAKLATLTGLGNLSGGSPSGINTPQAPGAAPQSSPQSSAPQMSTPENPQFAVPPAQRPQQSEPPASGTLGGPAGGVPMEAWLAMDPSGGKYLAQLAEDNKPIALRQGDLVGRVNGKVQSLFQQPQMVPGIVPTRDSNGQATGARQLPGFAPAVSDIKAQETSAVEGAKFPFTPIQSAGGGTIPAFLAGIKGPGQQPSPGVASLSVTQPSPNAPTTQPASQPASQPPGQPQSGDPWSDIPKRYAPQGVGQTTFDRAMADKQAEAASGLSVKLGTQADAANQRIALNNQAKALVDRADTGPMAAQIGDVKNWLVSRFNVPEGDFANTPSATAALQKDLLNAATNRAKQQFGSRMTQSEVMLMLSRGAPNIDMPKAAIKYLIDSDSTMAGYSIQQANDFSRFLQQGGDPMKFEGWYARKFPAATAMASAHLDTGSAPAKSGVRTYNPATGRIE